MKYMNFVPNVVMKHDGKDVMLDPITKEFIKNNVIYMVGEVTSESATLFESLTQDLIDDGAKEVLIKLKGPGGSVDAGLEIIDRINEMKNSGITVTIVATGKVASMDAVILSAGTKGRRYIAPSAKSMIHQVLGGSQGKLSDMKIQMDEMISAGETVTKILAENTGRKPGEIKKATMNDKYMTAEATVKFGLADAIGRPEKNKQEEEVYDEF